MATPVKIEGLDVYSDDLEFMEAADLVPELLSVIGPAFGSRGESDAAVASAIGGMAAALSGGKLTGLLPRLLARTIVVVPPKLAGGKDGIKADLSEGAAAINDAFRGRKKAGLAVIKHVLQQNFSDFFDGSDLAALGAAASR